MTGRGVVVPAGSDYRAGHLPLEGAMPKRKRVVQAAHSVYVIELSPEIYEVDRKFRETNPGWHPRKPCVYVGKTGLTPEQRFENHLRGRKGSRRVRRFGVRLRPRLYRRWNPLTSRAAEEREKLLAMRLRSRGYAVWQN